MDLKEFIENEQKIYVENTAGSSIDAWDTNYLPPEEWAATIFEDAQKTAELVPTIVRRYDSPRKVTVPVATITSSEWVSTVGGNVRSTGSTHYDATGIALDPVEYRTYMPIARKSLEEATWAVEADVRNRLTNAVALKLDTEAWTCLDSNGLASGKFQAGGEALDKTTTGNAVDYGTGLTAANVVDAIYNVRNTSYNFFKPNTAIVTPAITAGLAKQDTFLKASEFGSASFLQTGVFAKFLGLDWKLSGNIPQDSGSTDIGLIFDKNYMFVANIPHEFELTSARRYETDEIEFFAKCKGAFSVGDSEAGAVLYT